MRCIFSSIHNLTIHEVVLAYGGKESKVLSAMPSSLANRFANAWWQY